MKNAWLPRTDQQNSFWFWENYYYFFNIMYIVTIFNKNTLIFPKIQFAITQIVSFHLTLNFDTILSCLLA